MRRRSAIHDGTLLLLLGWLGASSSLLAADDPRLAEALAPGLERGYPGLAALVESSAGGDRAAAVGFADLVRRTPMRVDSAFHMASINKTFTAAAALQLVDQHRLSLDATLASLLGDEVAAIPNSATITVAQLLDHSSGIYPTNNDSEYLATIIGERADPHRVWSTAELVALADGARQKPVAAPGAGHHYSDTNYILLGRIVEKVSGEPYKLHLRRTILEPLGLRSTWFYSNALAPGAEAPAVTVRGYLLATPDIREAVAISPIFRPLPGAGRPDAPLLDTTLAAERIDAAGGLVTTLPDLVRFASALFRGRLLSPASQRLLVAAGDGMEEQPVGTARVWTLQAIRQPWGVALYKEGDSPGGVNTLMAYHPASDTIFVGFANSFGHFDEVDFLFDVFGEALAAAK